MHDYVRSVLDRPDQDWSKGVVHYEYYAVAMGYFCDSFKVRDV